MKTLRKVLKWTGLTLLGLIVFGGIVYLALPKGPRDLMEYTDRTKQPRQLLAAQNYAVVAGTPWATQAALDVLERGGNACDAAVAALLMLNVTHGEAASFAGVAPTMYYNASTGEVRSYIGAGKAPLAATIEKFQDAGFETVPDFNIWNQLIPASPDVITGLLTDCGSMSFGELAAPAIALARLGFPAHAILVRNLEFSLLERIGFSIIMPSTAEVYLRGEWWRPIHLHDRMQFPELADSFEELANAEAKVLQAGGTRTDGIAAVRDYFYKGPIAGKIVAFHQAEGGLITAEDLGSYAGGWETAVAGQVGAYIFYSNGTWSQGILESLILRTLEDLDLASMGHNSPQYIHTVTQAIELAMADRDKYIADPAFVEVPLGILLSDEYAAGRRAEMTDRAFPQLPAPGVIPGYGGVTTTGRLHNTPGFRVTASGSFAIGQDTSQLVVVDAQGNAVVMTPSDFPKSPMLPGTGINLGDRMTQFRLEPGHINALEPGKRPRITPHALIVFKDGEFFLAFSTPGGDMQSQALVQVFLNMEVFGMDLQSAINAPRFYSISAPSSFAPNEFTPAGLRLESDLYKDVAMQLTALGYHVIEDPDWDKDFGAVGAILRGPDGLLYAGSDPREETTAGGR
jgi:gamma-glutamyltranspeptidase/glutathione hydrolase